MSQEESVKVSPDQVQLAASAGLQLLADPDIKVPVTLALTDQLKILQAVLTSLASGKVILAAPKPPEEAKAPEGPKTPEDPTKLTEVAK